MASRLTKETLDVIVKNQIELYGPLAKALNTKVGTLDNYITRNARRLTEYPALQILSDYTGKPIHDLIEEYDDDEGSSGDLGTVDPEDKRSKRANNVNLKETTAD